MGLNLPNMRNVLLSLVNILDEDSVLNNEDFVEPLVDKIVL